MTCSLVEYLTIKLNTVQICQSGRWGPALMCTNTGTNNDGNPALATHHKVHDLRVGGVVKYQQTHRNTNTHYWGR